MPELALPPLDPNVLDSADADLDRRAQFLRAQLAEGRHRPSRLALIRCELLDVEAQLKRSHDGDA